jgi:hypothetical protein
MILCDAVHFDPGTGKAYILGCFSSIGASDFPAAHSGMAVFVEVTDCRGSTPFLVRVVDVDEQREPLVEAKSDINVDDPLQVVMFTLPLENLVFPAPSVYRVQLFSGRTLLMERRMELVPHPQEQEK